MHFDPGISYLDFPVSIKKSLRASTFSIGSEQILFSTLRKGISVVFDFLLINLLMTLQVPLTLSSCYLIFKVFPLQTTIVRIDLISHFLIRLH